MKLSIVIASYNRSESLLRFLKELGRQVVPEGVEWEVLIVDNNSSDGTKSRIAPFLEVNPNSFKYIMEKRQGKSLALNTGLGAATGEILIFTDDDCVPDSHWLANIAHEFSSDQSLGAVGGRVELFDKRDKAVTIRTSMERTLISSCNQLFSLLIGANMAIHRRVFEAIGQFDPFLGPGSRIGAVMEDLDLLYRIFRKEFKILYSPDILVYHNHGRTTEEQLQVLNHKYVVGRGAFYCKHILGGDLKVLKMAYWETSALAKSLLKDLFTGKKFVDESRVLWALFVGAVSRLAWNQHVRKI